MKFKKVLKNITIDLKKVAKKIWRHKVAKKIILGIGIFIFGFAGIFFVFTLSYQDKIYPHTLIGNTNFGGMTKTQAKEMLDKLIASSDDSKLIYRNFDKEYILNIKDMGVDYKNLEEASLDALFAVGRIGPPGEILKETMLAIFSKNRVYAKFNFEEIKLDEFLNQIVKDIDIAEKDATLEIIDNQPVLVEEEVGRKFEIVENKNITINAIGSFQFPDNMSYKISEISPKVDSKTAEAAIPETLTLLSHEIMLTATDKTFPITSKDIAEMITFTARKNKIDLSKTGVANKMSGKYVLVPEISESKTQVLVDKIAPEVYQEAKDPKFQVTGSRVSAFQLAQTGYELDKTKAVAQIIQAIKNGEPSSLELPITVTEPTIASNDPADLGLKEEIGVGTTNFAGSPSNRRHNISVGANTFDGVMLKPGEELSMIKYLGPVEASTGYLPELVIKEDRTIPEYGGGLCQVSTTMFRAALNAGLKITERQNHSYRVRYYEPPVGMDATIYLPKPDFKFVNDTENHILIQTEISGNNLTFRFFGTKDGRRAESSDPVVYDITGSGEPIYIESGDLAPGEIKQVESAHPGSKASFTYKVFDASNNLMHQETFTSFYVPWPARYLYGPGTEGIPQPPPAE